MLTTTSLTAQLTVQGRWSTWNWRVSRSSVCECGHCSADLNSNQLESQPGPVVCCSWISGYAPSSGSQPSLWHWFWPVGWNSAFFGRVRWCQLFLGKWRSNLTVDIPAEWGMILLTVFYMHYSWSIHPSSKDWKSWRHHSQFIPSLWQTFSLHCPALTSVSLYQQPQLVFCWWLGALLSISYPFIYLNYTNQSWYYHICFQMEKAKAWEVRAGSLDHTLSVNE